jgi:uncharacterized protein with von Willebrand factor type A (vWA) domain
MYSFILEILLMFSLGVMIYLLARTIPRIDDAQDLLVEKWIKKDKLLTFFHLQKFDLLLNSFLEKGLRRLRLWLMKIENMVSNYLKRVQEFNGTNQKSNEEKPTLFSSANIEKQNDLENNISEQISEVTKENDSN